MATKHLSTPVPMWAPFLFYGIITALTVLAVGR